jgi:hypothetical protein
MVACTEPRSKIPTLSESVARRRRHSLAAFSGLDPISYSSSPCSLVSLQFIFSLTAHGPLPAAHCCLKSFSCNTYGSPRKCCKAKPFRCNTYKKAGEGGAPTPCTLYRSPIFRTHFQVPYPVTPLFATLTKTPRAVGYSSQFGKRAPSLPQPCRGPSPASQLSSPLMVE